jgi:integrase
LTISKRTWPGPDGKPRSVWRIHVVETTPDGRVVEVRRKAKVNDKEHARREEMEVRRQILLGERVDGPTVEEAPPPLIETVGEFANTFRSHNKVHCKHGTQIFYEEQLALHILPLVLHRPKCTRDSACTCKETLADLPLDKVTVDTIEELQNAGLAKGHKPATVNNALTTLSRLLSLAFERKKVKTEFRFRKLRVPRREPKFLTFEQAEALLELVKRTEPHWYALVMTGLKTGLRIGELIALRWTDVDLKGKRLLVRRAFYRGVESDTKNHENREVPLTEQALEMLKDHRVKMGLTSPYVFCRVKSEEFPRKSARGELGSRLSYGTAAGVFDRLGKQLTGKVMGPHVLRHSFASHLVMRGIPLKVVSELMGHSSVQVTEIYAHLAPQVSRAAVLVLDAKGT